MHVVEPLGAFGDKNQNRDSIELSIVACCSGIKDISEHAKKSISPSALLQIL